MICCSFKTPTAIINDRPEGQMEQLTEFVDDLAVLEGHDCRQRSDLSCQAMFLTDVHTHLVLARYVWILVHIYRHEIIARVGWCKTFEDGRQDSAGLAPAVSGQRRFRYCRARTDVA